MKLDEFVKSGVAQYEGEMNDTAKYYERKQKEAGYPDHEYETGTEAEVIKAMAEIAIRKLTFTVHSIYTMPEERLSAEAQLRDFKKLMEGL